MYVWRRDSRKLPIGDPDVDWEETIYLNLIVHLFDYKITLAICTRTSPNNLQVHFSQHSVTGLSLLVRLPTKKLVLISYCVYSMCFIMYCSIYV
jgi:hypothetical protein